jgi:hypothetical protein
MLQRALPAGFIAPCTTTRHMIGKHELASMKPEAIIVNTRSTLRSNGDGGLLHLAGELFKMMTGIDLVHVPYRGAQPALTDLISGQVQVMFVASTVEYIKTGKVRDPLQSQLHHLHWLHRTSVRSTGRAVASGADLPEPERRL